MVRRVFGNCVGPQLFPAPEAWGLLSKDWLMVPISSDGLKLLHDVSSVMYVETK